MTRDGFDDRASADEALAAAARAGDDAAFAELWRRHAAAGAVAARQFAHIADADDLLSEAYLRILAALRRGGGPRGAFRPYLYRTIRNLAMDWRRPAELALEDAPDADTMVPGPELAAAERALGFRAFRSLPPRWQSVLWYLDVEGLQPSDAAPLLGLSPNATSVLAGRAREGLKKAWLQAHVNETAVPEGCRWTTERMGDYARGSLTRRRRERFERHVATCERCSALLEEVEDAGGRLAVLLLPLFLGGSAAAALLPRPDGDAGSPTAAPAGGSATALAATARVPLSVAVASVAVLVVAGVAWGLASLPRGTEAPAETAETPVTEPSQPPATPAPTPTPTVTEAPAESAPVTPPRPARPPAPQPSPSPTPTPTPPPAPASPVDVVEPGTNRLLVSGAGDVPGAVIELWGTTTSLLTGVTSAPALLASVVVQPDGTWTAPAAGGITPVNVAVTVRQVRDGLASPPVELFSGAMFYVGAELHEATVAGSTASWTLLGWPGAAWEIRDPGDGTVLASGVLDADGRSEASVPLPAAPSGTVFGFDVGYVQDGAITVSVPGLTATAP